MTVTLRASFEVSLCDFKNKHTVAKPLSLAKREWLVGENPTRKFLRDGCSK